MARDSSRRTIIFSVAGVIVLVCGLTWLATDGEDLLPRMLPDATRVTLWGQFLTGLLVLLGLVALVLLWLRRRSVLDLWLMVVMCAWMLDIALSAMLNAKWKSGPASGTSKTEPVRAGEVRSFRITKLDAGAKRIELELA
jgi:hypothetical protein